MAEVLVQEVFNPPTSFRYTASTSIDATFSPNNLQAGGLFTVARFLEDTERTVTGSSGATVSTSLAYVFSLETAHAFAFTGTVTDPTFDMNWKLGIYDEAGQTLISGAEFTENISSALIERSGVLEPGTYRALFLLEADSETATIDNAYDFQLSLTEQPSAVPLPPAVWTGLIGLVGAIGASRLRRQV
jgi:hypothetical protein